MNSQPSAEDSKPLAREKSLRQIILFPKTANNTDPICDAHSEVSDENLRQLNFQVRAKRT